MKIKRTILSVFLFSLVITKAPAQNFQPAVLSTPGGRYVLGQISEARADQYLLDTQTGRLWEIVVDTNNANSLQEVPYKALDGTLTLVPQNPQDEVQSSARALNNEQQQQAHAMAINAVTPPGLTDAQVGLTNTPSTFSYAQATVTNGVHYAPNEVSPPTNNIITP